MTKITSTDLKKYWIERFGLHDPADLDLSVNGGLMQTANEYIAAGIDPDTYLNWYGVGGFDIDSMLELTDAGINIKLTAELTSEGRGGYNNTIAYKYCNGDLNLDAIRAILGC
jgi:hypothetical protein